jgi:DNA-binding CsgD family transcriptional regulator
LSFFTRNKQIILYGFALALFLFLLRWLEMRFVLVDDKLDIYIGIIALIFTGLGVWLAFRLRKPALQTVIVEKEIFRADNASFILNEQEMKRLNLSKRELEVLQLMSEGLSNQEIAERLFVSLNTVKTHSAQIFEKMKVKRRTQAIELGRRLSIIP